MSKHWVIGVDFGTASVRALLIDAMNGEELFTSEASYPRWAKGMYCDPSKNKYRQHPQDYIDGLISVINAISKFCGTEHIKHIKAMSFDTTGSTPGPVDATGQPLALQKKFWDNPNAMFYLWKDHTAIEEAQEINTSNTKSNIDFLKSVGGIYSSEWYWAKLIHAFRMDEAVFESTVNWVEHCDWMPFLLTGGTHVELIKRGSCAAGHKALWSSGVNPQDTLHFMQQLEPKLLKFKTPLFDKVYPATSSAGKITLEWADKLGLHQDVMVGIGTIDAHAGAVGGEIQNGMLIKVMGTSTCDMMVVPQEALNNRYIKGISGQADDSIIPGMVGLEAGQSAFGDGFDWFTKLLMASSKTMIQECDFLDDDQKRKLQRTLEKNIFKQLEKEASKIEMDIDSPQALEWLNGRRTPDNNPNLKASFFNLDLSSTAPHLYLALIEATCFGARRIVETFNDQGQHIKGVIGLGGIAQKSPLIMQFMADSLGIPIEIHASLNTCALGSAMYAAVVAGIHPTVAESQKAMGAGFIKTYVPDKNKSLLLEERYQIYLKRGQIEENLHLAQ